MKNIYHASVIIGGFAGSGSSAVVDLLKEVKGTVDPNVEWRFITDPDGILSLDSVLQNTWTPYQSDVALKRFRELIYALSGKYRAPYCGYNMNSLMTSEFETISLDFLSRIEDVSFVGMWTGISDIKHRIFHKLNNMLGTNFHFFEKKISVMSPSPKTEDLIKKYLQDLISAMSIPDDSERIIIDEPFSSLNANRVCELFGPRAKSIITLRDPRDIYINALKYKYDFIPREITQFVGWYSNIMARFKSQAFSEQIHVIHFEDLVTNYDITVKGIFDFLNIDPAHHSQKGKFLKPEKSALNVGLWKTNGKPEDMKYIKFKLGEICW